MIISPDPVLSPSACYARLEQALREPDPQQKCRLVTTLWADWQAGVIGWPDPNAGDAIWPVDQPGKPEKPELVSPHQVKSRGIGNALGRATMLHAVAHIEFNAINLALDHAYRFRPMPRDYVGGWLRVAFEEVEHFGLVTDHLRSLRYAYGDFPAHQGLWDMACKTAQDPLVRMALIPRLFEARGLDVTPGIIEKFKQVCDTVAVAALEVILREEVGHVALGDFWFRHLCAERGLDPEPTYLDLIRQYDAPRLKPPFNETARMQAGFSADELDSLKRFALEVSHV